MANPQAVPDSMSKSPTRPPRGVSSWVHTDPEAAASAAQRTRLHKALFRRARQQSAKLLRRIELHVEGGNARHAREALRTYLSSFYARLLAFERANKSLKAPLRVSTAQLIQMAGRLNPFGPETEPVEIWAKKKADGGYRPIHKFGIRQRARQQLVVAGLRPFIHLRADQFAQQGGGRNAAIRKIRDHIEAGARWFIERDVADCYGTFASNRNIVQTLSEWLPLPQEVVRHCITAVEYSFADYIPNETCSMVSLRVDSRGGLPQGSSSSTLVAEARMAQVLDDAERSGALEQVAIASYADNVALLSATRSRLSNSMITLERSVVRCSSGSWRLKPRRTPRRVDHGFDFLGYHIRKVGAEVTIQPSEDNLAQFVEHCRSKLRRQSLPELGRYVTSWVSAFSEAPAIAALARRTLIKLASEIDPALVPSLRAIAAGDLAGRHHIGRRGATSASPLRNAASPVPRSRGHTAFQSAG